jgi:apolipoprotein N-acyltransferase
MRALPLGVTPRHGLFAIGIGLLSAASFPPIGLWPLSIVAIVLLLRLIRERTVSEARNLGLLYGLAYGLGTMYWFFSLVGVIASLMRVRVGMVE